MTSTLQEAISAVRDNDYEEAQRMLSEIIHDNPDEVQAWYLLSQLVDSDARRALYLSKTLSLNPYHERAWAEFFSLPPEVVNRLEPGQVPVPPPSAAATDSAQSLEAEAALPEWLRPVAGDQPVVAQRRPAPPVAVEAPAPVPMPAAVPVKSPETAPPASQGNRTLSVLLAVLLIATIVVLAFLVYLLLQG